MYRFLSECIFTQKWIYWTICVTFLGTAKLFCKVTVRVHYHQQCVTVSCSLIQNFRLSDDKLGFEEVVREMINRLSVSPNCMLG